MITLPALCFDKLALSVNTHGLGAGRYYRYDLDRHVPVPLDWIAHFETCFGDCDNVHRFGITTAMSDKAVYAINKRKRALPGARVNWTEFVGELAIYRGCEHSAEPDRSKLRAYVGTENTGLKLEKGA
jgi:hypothetical protein